MCELTVSLPYTAEMRQNVEADLVGKASTALLPLSGQRPDHCYPYGDASRTVRFRFHSSYSFFFSTRIFTLATLAANGLAVAQVAADPLHVVAATRALAARDLNADTLAAPTLDVRTAWAPAVLNPDAAVLVAALNIAGIVGAFAADDMAVTLTGGDADTYILSATFGRKYEVDVPSWGSPWRLRPLQ